LERDDAGDVSLRVIGHSPRQFCDLLRPQASFHRQPEDKAIPLRVPRGGEAASIASTCPLLSIAACLFNHIASSRYLSAVGRWTVIGGETQYMPNDIRAVGSFCKNLISERVWWNRALTFDVYRSKTKCGTGGGNGRWRLWTRFRLAGRKRAVINRPMSVDIDEFAQLLSSRDPAALKQLAARLTGNAQVQPIADKRSFTKR
jgi:hypothetical protein